MWKKSGAWFYREMPNFRRPTESDPGYNGLYGPSSSFSTNVIMCNGGPTTPINNNNSGRRSRGPGDYGNLSNSGGCSPVGLSNNRNNSGGHLGRIKTDNISNVQSHKRSTTNAPLPNAFGALSLYKNNGSRSNNESPNNAFFPLYNPLSQSCGNELPTPTPSQRQLPIPPDQQQR